MSTKNLYANNQNVESDLAFLWQSIKRGKMLIALVASMFTLLAVIAVGMMESRYRSTATILLEPNLNSSVDIDKIQSTSAIISPQHYATQLAVLKSRNIAARALAYVSWEKYPDYVSRYVGESGGRVPDFIQGLSESINNEMPSATKSNGIYQKFLSGFVNGRSVEAVYPTKIVKIHFVSTDPALSMDAANALATAYITKLEDDQRRRRAAIYDWLQQRIGLVKKQLSFRKKQLHGFLASEAGKSVYVSRTLLEEEVAKYRRELQEKKLELVGDEAKSGSPGEVMASEALDPNGGVAESGANVQKAEALLVAAERDLAQYDEMESTRVLLKDQVESSWRIYHKLTGSLMELEASSEFPAIQARVVDYAIMPMSASAPPRLKIVFLALWAGVVLGVLAAILRYKLGGSGPATT